MLQVVNLDEIAESERTLMDDALRDFRLVRPGDRKLVEIPFRDSSGTLVSVHYMFADRPGLIVGRALRQPNGHLAVQLG